MRIIVGLRNGVQCCVLWESRTTGQFERNGDNLGSMTPVRNSQCLGMRIERLRTCLKKKKKAHQHFVWVIGKTLDLPQWYSI